MKNPLQEQLDQLRDARDQAINAAQALVTSEDYDPNDSTLKGLEERAEQLDGQIARLVKLMEAQTAADALDGRLGKAAKSQTRSVSGAETDEPDSDNWGEVFTRSDEYKDYRFRGDSAQLDIEARALPHSLTSMAAPLSLGLNKTVDITPPKPKFKFLPLASVIPVSTNSVDFVTWSKVTGSAAVVAEGATKPTIEWGATTTSSSLDTIAGRTSMTRQLAEDSQAVVSYINGELQYEVVKATENLALSAIDTAVGTVGTASGPAVKASSTTYGNNEGDKQAQALLGAILQGKTDLEEAGYEPNAFLVTAADKVKLSMYFTAKAAATGADETDRFYGLTPVVMPSVVPSLTTAGATTASTLTAGSVLVGDFKKAVTHFTRNSVKLYFTDSHDQNFAKNILDALAETRGLTKVVRPGALEKVTATLTS